MLYISKTFKEGYMKAIRGKVRRYDVLFGLRISKDQSNGLQMLALKHNKDCSELMRMCIDCMLHNDQCKARMMLK